MLRNLGAIIAVATAGLAAGAHAEEHTVMLMGNAYFPDVSYVQEGDTIRFVNLTNIVQTATAQDGSWTSGPLGENQAFVLPVVMGVKQVFISDNDPNMLGQFQYGEAPLD